MADGLRIDVDYYDTNMNPVQYDKNGNHVTYPVQLSIILATAHYPFTAPAYPSTIGDTFTLYAGTGVKPYAYLKKNIPFYPGAVYLRYWYTDDVQTMPSGTYTAHWMAPTTSALIKIANIP